MRPVAPAETTKKAQVRKPKAHPEEADFAPKKTTYTK
jgi:hypothetical protein